MQKLVLFSLIALLFAGLPARSQTTRSLVDPDVAAQRKKDSAAAAHPWKPIIVKAQAGKVVDSTHHTGMYYVILTKQDAALLLQILNSTSTLAKILKENMREVPAFKIDSSGAERKK